MATAKNNAWLVPVFALFLSAFAICTAELIPAGVLPAIARDLGVDISTAGLLITGYALGVAIIGPLLALATGGVQRRRLLIIIMAIFVAGNLLCAFAGSYWSLLGARLVVAACHGLFFGVAMIVATRVAPEGRKTSAVSLVVAGVTLSSVAGVPLGTAIGNVYGWRTTLMIIAAAGALAAIIVALLVPAGDKQERHAGDLAAEVRAAARPSVLLCYTIIALNMTGIFCTLAYIVPMLTEVSGVPLGYVPLVLAAMGGVGIFGNLIGGRLGDWNATATMIGILCATITIFALLSFVASSTWLAILVLMSGWLIGFGFPAPVQGRILKDVADAPNFGATLVSTAFNIGIAAGAALGGAAIAAGWSYGHLPLLTSLFHFLALLATLGLYVFDRRRAAVAVA